MRLVVIADSLSFHGPDGPLPLSDDRLYPQVARAQLAAATGHEWTVDVIARAGWCMRDVWLALQKDVHLQQQVLIGADAVVMAVGSSDALTVGVPRVATLALSYLRPTRLRRRVRRALDDAHPTLIRLTGERLRWTPSSVYRHCWRKSIEGLRLFTGDAPLCAIVPCPHDGPYYARSLRHLDAAIAETVALAADLAVPLVDLPALITPHLHRLNVDGLHWPFEAHADVGVAMAETLVPALRRTTTGGTPARSAPQGHRPGGVR
jgi:diglucosylglycerate octanoyltransferase